MIEPLAGDGGRRLRDFMHGSGYTTANLEERLGTVFPPPLYHHQRPELIRCTSAPTPFDCLARCFFLGTAVEHEIAARALPSWLLKVCLECGLLTREGELLEPQALLTPFEELWVAADLHQQREEASGSEHVLPLNSPAAHLMRFALRRRVGSALDLCSGNALHGLAACGFSERVVASDLSPRARSYAEFNAALNGDLFAPLADDRFDLILCNPPFVLSPATDYLYRDSPLELDGFCRRVVQEAPEHLNEDGYCQIVCEWVEVENQSWQDRLKGWLGETGCDAWVLHANVQRPSSYVSARLQEHSNDAAGEEDAGAFQTWMEYLESRGVESIHGGVITMRRRAAHNWISLGQLVRGVDRPIGDAVLQGFAARDFLQAHSDDERLLAARPAIAADASLEEHSLWRDGAWQTESITLRVDAGVPAAIGVDESLRHALDLFDGRHRVEEVLRSVCERQGMAVAEVQEPFLNGVRVLIEQGCLVP
jgi:methylase of polypeptide subunit release factors